MEVPRGPRKKQESGSAFPQGPPSHQSSVWIKLIRFWYQVFPASYASTPVKLHGPIYYLFILICLLFPTVAWVRVLLPVIPGSPSPHSVLKHLSSPGSFADIGLGSYGFFPLPFTQWQRAEVLWGLGANELTLQRWGRCSVTQGRGVRGQCDQGRSGLEAESRPRCQAETSASKVVLSAKVGLLFNMSLNIW